MSFEVKDRWRRWALELNATATEIDPPIVSTTHVLGKYLTEPHHHSIDERQEEVDRQ
jgi:hypothetical protein